MNRSGEMKWLLKNGNVFKVDTESFENIDIMISDEKISAIGKNIQALSDSIEIDCTGLIVSAGLVDIHTHLYEHATSLGVDPDTTCLANGVTTAIDGGSAGFMTFKGLKKFIVDKSCTRTLAFLHIACHGLAGAGCSGPEFGPGGESDHLNALKINQCVKTIREHCDVIVGVKLRLDRNVTDDGNIEPEALKRALAAAREASLPLMLHHTMSTLALEDVLASLAPGDIYTHTFSSWAGEGNSIVNKEKRELRECVLEARKRGVLFDVGHGQGSFDWEVAEICAENNFYPDIISTDLHSGNVGGAAKNLPWVMGKLLYLGNAIFHFSFSRCIRGRYFGFND